LERAKEIDRAILIRSQQQLPIPMNSFKQTLYRQPSLAEGALKPAPYRHHPSEQNSLTSKELFKKYCGSDEQKDLQKDLLSHQIYGDSPAPVVLKDSYIEGDIDDTYYDLKEESEDVIELDRKVSLFLSNYRSQPSAAEEKKGDIESNGNEINGLDGMMNIVGSDKVESNKSIADAVDKLLESSKSSAKVIHG
jgi:hypothetical protein